MIHIQKYVGLSEVLGKHGLLSPAIVKVGSLILHAKIGPRKLPLLIYIDDNNELSINVEDLAIIGNQCIVGTSRIGKRIKINKE